MECPQESMTSMDLPWTHQGPSKDLIYRTLFRLCTYTCTVYVYSSNPTMYRNDLGSVQVTLTLSKIHLGPSGTLSCTFREHFMVLPGTLLYYFNVYYSCNPETQPNYLGPIWVDLTLPMIPHGPYMDPATDPMWTTPWTFSYTALHTCVIVSFGNIFFILGCDLIENKFQMGCDPIENKVLIGL